MILEVFGVSSKQSMTKHLKEKKNVQKRNLIII